MAKLIAFFRSLFPPARFGICHMCGDQVAADQFECAECNDARQY